MERKTKEFIVKGLMGCIVLVVFGLGYIVGANTAKTIYQNTIQYYKENCIELNPALLSDHEIYQDYPGNNSPKYPIDSFG